MVTHHQHRPLFFWLVSHLSLVLSDEKVPDNLIQDEAAAYRYFQKTTPYGTPMRIHEYSNLSPEKFDELASSGLPFVIKDGGAGQPFVGWTCDRFRTEYPNAVVKIEYVRGVKAVWDIKDNWQAEVHKIPHADPGGPKYGPWYWGVKGADDPSEARTIFAGNKNPLSKVQGSMRLPPWMRKSGENQQEVLGSPEFWFSMPDAGATMHMDAHCESTYAIQLSGTRKWRIGWAPPVPNGTMFKEGTYADGAVYGKQYMPPLEAVVSEGEAFFMPSAFLHETTNVGDGCAVSLTFQFRDPIPARYWRHSLRHLRRTGDFNECWDLLRGVAGMGGKREPEMNKVDKNKDGVFTVDEASSRVLRAAHAFHDEDADGKVTVAELRSGWQAWLSANTEAKDTKQKRPKSFSYVAQGKVEL